LALTAYEWMGGLRTRELEAAFQVRAGALRAAGGMLSWIVDVMAAIVPHVGGNLTLAEELSQLSERLAHGVAADGLFLARLGVPGLGRESISRLVTAGFTSEDALLDAPPGAFQGIIQGALATRLRVAIERRVANTLERRKREHVRRAEAAGAGGQLVRNVYERQGEELERVVADLFVPPFYPLLPGGV